MTDLAIYLSTPQVVTLERVEGAATTPLHAHPAPAAGADSEADEDQKFFLGWLGADGAWVDVSEVVDDSDDGAAPAGAPEYYATFSPAKGG